MYHLWELDVKRVKNGPKSANAARDPDYDSEEPEVFYDPDFEDEWHRTDGDGEDDSIIVDENPLELPVEPFGEVELDDGEIPSKSDIDDWEEV